MTIITSVPPPDRRRGRDGLREKVFPQEQGGSGGDRSPRGRHSPVRFVGRVLRTLWSNGKARTGMIILGLIIVVAVFAPLLAPHSPTATSYTPYLGPSGTNLL